MEDDQEDEAWWNVGPTTAAQSVVPEVSIEGIRKAIAELQPSPMQLFLQTPDPSTMLFLREESEHQGHRMRSGQFSYMSRAVRYPVEWGPWVATKRGHGELILTIEHRERFARWPSGAQSKVDGEQWRATLRARDAVVWSSFGEGVPTVTMADAVAAVAPHSVGLLDESDEAQEVLCDLLLERSRHAGTTD